MIVRSGIADTEFDRHLVQKRRLLSSLALGLDLSAEVRADMEHQPVAAHAVEIAGDRPAVLAQGD